MCASPRSIATSAKRATLRPSSAVCGAVNNAHKAGAPASSFATSSFAKSALVLAERRLGQTADNPAVGCVLFSESAPLVIARGATAEGGRPHAEESVLQEAGELAQGATLYVSLEPCAHKRAGGSCAEKIVRAGVKRVIYATADPDPRTAGQGGTVLRAGGVEVLPETKPRNYRRGKTPNHRALVSCQRTTPCCVAKTCRFSRGFDCPVCPYDTARHFE